MIDSSGRATSKGLSPRKRGNHLHRSANSLPKGPIPAQAGEPWRVAGGGVKVGAYPRAGGGTRAYLNILRPLTEPIPAQAGNHRHCSANPIPKDLSPRTGGGTCTAMVL